MSKMTDGAHDVKPAMSPEELHEAAVMGSVQLLKAGQAFYNEKADPGELDLVATVREYMKEYGVDEDTLVQKFDNNTFVVESANRHTLAQQFNLTRWADEQFTIIQAQDGIDTRTMRFQAIYEVKPEAWLKIFKEGLLPNLVEHGIRTY